MLKILQLSHKTYVPFCGLECCGNKFGRIERSCHANTHGRINRMKRARRYAKHVERQLIKKEIASQLHEEYLEIMEFIEEMQELFADMEY